MVGLWGFTVGAVLVLTVFTDVPEHEFDGVVGASGITPEHEFDGVVGASGATPEPVVVVFPQTKVGGGGSWPSGAHG